eukprot:3030593-Prymnesium_polylepis.1
MHGDTACLAQARRDSNRCIVLRLPQPATLRLCQPVVRDEPSPSCQRSPSRSRKHPPRRQTEAPLAKRPHAHTHQGLAPTHNLKQHNPSARVLAAACEPRPAPQFRRYAPQPAAERWQTLWPPSQRGAHNPHLLGHLASSRGL